MTTFIPPARRNLPISVARKAVRALPLLAALPVLAAQVAAPAAEAPRRGATATRQASAASAPAATTIVDHDVQPAGGACRQCGPAGCKHGHHRDCRDGACSPYCPVRPTTFGFYGTQWRRWPGSGVVPVSNEQAATPVKPPKSSVPGPDEESLGPKPSELPEPDFPSGEDEGRGDRAAAPEPMTPEPTAPASQPQQRREPAEEPAAPAPDAGPVPEAAPAKPEAAPVKPRPQDDNLFDESAASRVRRKIPVAVKPRPTQPAQRAAGRVQPAAHQEAPRQGAATSMPAARAPSQGVSRVAWDPRQESDRLRQPAR